MIKLSGPGTFKWLSSEQVYPFEKDSDDSTLYCKEVDVGSMPNNGNKQVDSGVTITQIHRMWGEVKQTSNNDKLPLPYVGSTYVGIQVSANYVNINTSTNFSGYSGKVYIIYKH